MSLAHLAIPLISLTLSPKTSSHPRSQDFRSKVSLQVVAGYTLALFRVGGGSHRSAVAAAAGELGPLFGGSSILAKAEGELEPLFGGSSSCQKWIAVAYGAAVAFRSFTGPLVLSQ